MIYALLILESEVVYENYSKEDKQALIEGNQAVAQQATSEQRYVGGMKLMSSATATTVRVRNGETLLLDGPYAESKEVLVGLHVVSCNSLEEAMQAAKRIPNACMGRVEIRPIEYLETAGVHAFTWTNSA